MPSYSQYKRQLAVLDADDTDIEAWITVKGNHIPIKKGQSKEEAVKSFIESKNGGGKSATPKKDSKSYIKIPKGASQIGSVPDDVAERHIKTVKEPSNTKKDSKMFAQQITGKPPFDPMKTDDKFKYQLLDRMRQDNDYWLKNGKNDKNLWAGNPKEQIATMRKLHNSLSKKPEWLTEEQINDYETKMLGAPKNNGKSTFYKNVSGKQIYNKPNISTAKKGYTAIENELLTEKEMKKHGFDPNSKGFEKVELGKNDHRYEMGARFETPKNKMSKPSDSDMSGGSINNIFQQANAGLQSFVDDTGYQPQTTFWSDFGIAEPFGEKAVEDTYNRAFREWKSDKVYLTELSMMLNWKLWQHYDKGNDKMARLYDKLWKQTDKYAHTHLKGDDLQYYIRTTD